MADMRRNRVLVFGAGEAGRQFASFLGRIAPGSMVGIVDNDPAKQGQRIEGMTVRRFADVSPDSYDLVVIASLPGRQAIAAQLETAGLVAHSHYVGTDEVRHWYEMVEASERRAA
jgi:FlaA1/EpsC-like NDP-sugar epimerase